MSSAEKTGTKGAVTELTDYKSSAMTLLLNDIISKFEIALPLDWQEPWDRCGLQVGERSQKVRSVLFAFDACHEVVRFAIKHKYSLIVTHHPLTLSKEWPTQDSYLNETLRLAIKNDIAIYSAHTNHDASPFSMNRAKALLLGLSDVRPLVPSSVTPYIKLAVFVPETHTAQVLKALFKAGAGHVGQYDSCSFKVRGQGTFRGLAGTKPFIGKAGVYEETGEDRIEVICFQKQLKKIIQALKQAHPYEEVAYDLYPLKNPLPIGQGLIGSLNKALTFKQTMMLVKKVFRLKNLPYAGKPRSIKTIALCTGSGGSLLTKAIAEGADLFLTGDVRYHSAIDALRADTVVADVGHFTSEIDSVKILQKKFHELFGTELKTTVYSRLKNPFKKI